MYEADTSANESDGGCLMGYELKKFNHCLACNHTFEKALLDALLGAICPVCGKVERVIEIVQTVKSDSGQISGWGLLAIGVAAYFIFKE